MHHKVRFSLLVNLIGLFQSERTDVAGRPPVSQVACWINQTCWGDKTGKGAELLSKISPNKKKWKKNILSKLIRACSTWSFAECLLMWTSGLFWFIRARSPLPPPFTSLTSSLASYQTFMSWLHMSTQGGLRFWRGVNISKHQQKRKQSLKTYLVFSGRQDGPGRKPFHFWFQLQKQDLKFQSSNTVNPKGGEQQDWHTGIYPCFIVEKYNICFKMFSLMVGLTTI